MGARWRDEPVNKHKDRGRKALHVHRGAWKTHPGASTSLETERSRFQDRSTAAVAETFHFPVTLFDGCLDGCCEKLLTGRFVLRSESFQVRLSPLWSTLLLVQPAAFVRSKRSPADPARIALKDAAQKIHFLSPRESSPPWHGSLIVLPSIGLINRLHVSPEFKCEHHLHPQPQWVAADASPQHVEP